MSEQEQALLVFIDEQVELFTDDVYSNLLRSMKEQKVSLTGATLRDLRLEVFKAANDFSAGMKLHMNSTGTIVSTAKFSKSFKPPIDALKQWVKNVGLNNFKDAGGVPFNKLHTQEDMINRIAWGLQARREKGDQISRRRGRVKNWFYPEFYGPLKTWRNNLIEKYTAMVADNILPEL